MIATANSHAIMIWNYENLRLMGTCYLDSMTIKQVNFLDPYPLMGVLDSEGTLYFIQLNYSESFQYYKAIFKIELDGSTDEDGVIDIPKCFEKSIIVDNDEED